MTTTKEVSLGEPAIEDYNDILTKIQLSRAALLLSLRETPKEDYITIRAEQSRLAFLNQLHEIVLGARIDKQ